MTISIITLFPKIFDPVLGVSIIGRAQKKGLVEFQFIDLREFGAGKHKVVDDKPYGGGPGMILRVDILAKATNFAINTKRITDAQKCVVLMSASGIPFTYKKARRLSKLNHLILVCGHYEGVDQRFVDKYVDEEISIGEYVLTGGELPAMVVADAVTRVIPGVLEKDEAIREESFEDGLLEYPHYTRPEEFEQLKVPFILTSGNHQNIAQWRKEKSIEKTRTNRPDLTKKLRVL